MDARSAVFNIAVPGDGKWIICGMKNDSVQVWSAEDHEKQTELETRQFCA